MKKGYAIGIVSVLILMITLVFSAQVFAETDSAAANVKLVEKGDTDKDGDISFRDALKVLKYAAKIENAESEDDIYRSDVDANDSINVTDAKIVFESALDGKNFGYEYLGDDANIIIVDSDSHYTDYEYSYTSLTDVVSHLNANPPASEEERITVLFAPGVYREHTELKAPYVTYRAMYPESEEKVNITFYYGSGYAYYSLDNRTAGSNEPSTIINKSAHDFIAEYIMFENSYNIYIAEGEEEDYCAYPINKQKFDIRAQADNIRRSTYQTQALALRVDADRCQFYNCDIIGRQDTLLMNGSGNRVYFEDCFIEGTVDFIYGNGTAVFESCIINSPYHSGHITAGSHDSSIEYGFLFKDCSLTRTATTPSAAPADAEYSLGRPWHNQPMVFYWNCKMDKHIAEGVEGYDVYHDTTGEWIGFQITDGRWRPMGDGNFITNENSRFAEVGTMDIEGNPIDLTTVCPDFETILEQSDMLPGGQYAAHKWLAGNDGWNPGGYPVE